MSWEAITRKDFQDSIRSYWLWGLSVLFIVFFGVPAYFFADRVGSAAQQQGQQLSTDAFLNILAEVNAFFVPVIAIVIAYAAIAGERDSGTLKLLLSLPHSRLDVVVGKVLGRGAVVALPVLVGFVVAGGIFLITPVEFGFANYVLFALLTALLAVTYVAIAIGFSAAAESARRAMIGTVGIYVLFTLFWNRFASGLINLLSEYADIGGESLVSIHLFVKVLNPSQAYKSLTLRLVTDTAAQARVSLIGGGGLQGQLNRQMYAQALGDSVPVYLSDPAVVVFMLAWLVILPAAGYYVFDQADL